MQIILAETLSNFGFGRNRFETRISAEISLHHYKTYPQKRNHQVQLQRQLGNVHVQVFGLKSGQVFDEKIVDSDVNFQARLPVKSSRFGQFLTGFACLNYEM